MLENKAFNLETVFALAQKGSESYIVSQTNFSETLASFSDMLYAFTGNDRSQKRLNITFGIEVFLL